MNRKFLITALILGIGLLAPLALTKHLASSQELHAVMSGNDISVFKTSLFDTTAAQASCNLPDQPKRVGLQVGHWKAHEAPDELQGLRDNTGTSGGGLAEWEVVMAIAKHTKTKLEANGLSVDLLPTTIPIDYCADVFVSVHADGSTDNSITGYKISSWRRDQTGKADELVSSLKAAYETVGLAYDDNITRNMLGYYAFNSRRYEHAIHPETPGAIIETGFLTNPTDAELLINQPELPAEAIADGIIKFLAAT